jgi:hypothetical protein
LLPGTAWMPTTTAVPFPDGSIATLNTLTGLYRVAAPAGTVPGLGASPAFIEYATEYAQSSNATIVSETAFDRKVGKLPWYKDWLYIGPIGGGAVVVSAVVLLLAKKRRKARR